MQQLLDCDSVQSGCKGGWMWNAYNYTKANGIALRADYPTDYLGEKRTCQYNEATMVHFKPENLGMIEQDRNTNLQMKALVAQQPVAIAMFATTILSRYKNGVATEEFLRCSSPLREVNHGVTLVGYGRVAPGDRVRGLCHEYWVIRNSWGADWGEEGFFRLCMDGLGQRNKPFGACLVNKYATWPTLDGIVVEP